MAEVTRERPTREELGLLLESVDLKTYGLFCTAAGDPEDPLSTGFVAAAAVFDWVTASTTLRSSDKMLAVLKRRHELAVFGNAFDLAGVLGVTFRPAIFSLVDGRYVVTRSGDEQQRSAPFFDLETQQELSRLPAQPLTTLACDLNVLMLRLLDKMERVRVKQQQQERTDADTANDRTAESRTDTARRDAAGGR